MNWKIYFVKILQVHLNAERLPVVKIQVQDEFQKDTDQCINKMNRLKKHVRSSVFNERNLSFQWSFESNINLNASARNKIHSTCHSITTEL